MGEVPAAYRGLRERVTALVRAAPPEALDRVAPATPQWRVRDVLAHLVGVPADVLAGRLDGVATDGWTAAQVDARRGASAADMLAEWEECGPQIEAVFEQVPFEVIGQAMYDAVTHEHDVRHALRTPGARDSDALALAWRWYLAARTRGGAPALTFVTEAGEEPSGHGDPVATIEAPRFELFRAATGRRTAAEIAAYGWDREPDPRLLLAAYFFTIRTESLGE